MKIKYYLVIYLLPLFCFLGCSDNDDIILNKQLKTEVEIDQESQNDIANFVNSVKKAEVKTRSGRIYLKRTWVELVLDCWTIAGGNCLYKDVIVTKETDDDVMVKSSEKVIESSDIDELWKTTIQAKELQNLIDSNEVSVTKFYNSSAKKIFYRYKSLKNSSLEIVIPVKVK